jgi:hypothetical protein
MFGKILSVFENIRDRQKISIALTKGAAMMSGRTINLTKPSTWEFSGFSQNGEDGVLQVLRSQLLKSNRYFIEIGSADGIANNSAWLAAGENYNGIMIEGNPRLVKLAQRHVGNLSAGAECFQMFVTKDNIGQLKSLSLHSDPDVLSLDIDGNDYYVMQSIFQVGFRPKIIVVEYNSTFGPTRSQTIEYDRNFDMMSAHPTWLYYGVSITGWKTFFKKIGYTFITVEQNGTNAFFVDPQFFSVDFLNDIQPLNFEENRYHLRKFRIPHTEQFLLIEDQKFVDI